MISKVVLAKEAHSCFLPCRMGSRKQTGRGAEIRTRDKSSQRTRATTTLHPEIYTQHAGHDLLVFLLSPTPATAPLALLPGWVTPQACTEVLYQIIQSAVGIALEQPHHASLTTPALHPPATPLPIFAQKYTTARYAPLFLFLKNADFPQDQKSSPPDEVPETHYTSCFSLL